MSQLKFYLSSTKGANSMEEVWEEMESEDRGKHSNYLDDLEESSWSYTQQGTWSDLGLTKGDMDD